MDNITYQAGEQLKNLLISNGFEHVAIDDHRNYDLESCRSGRHEFIKGKGQKQVNIEFQHGKLCLRFKESTYHFFLESQLPDIFMEALIVGIKTKDLKRLVSFIKAGFLTVNSHLIDQELINSIEKKGTTDLGG